MKHIAITLALFATLTSSQALAQAPAGVVTEDLLALKRNSLTVTSNTGGFFDSIAIERDGQRINIGFFGGDAAAYFTEKGLAQQSLSAYRAQKIAGVSLWSLGMATLIADLALTMQSATTHVRSDARGTLEWSLLGAGAATGMVGAILLGTAGNHLLDAVAQHNSTLLDEAIDRSLVPTMGMGTDGRGASVSLSLPF